MAAAAVLYAPPGTRLGARDAGAVSTSACRGQVARCPARSMHRHCKLVNRPSVRVKAGGMHERNGNQNPFALLLEQRVIFVSGEITDELADGVINQLMLLDSEDARRAIKLFINSPGGSVTAGMGIYDTMQLCEADVETYCMGMAASMGAFLLGAGARGKRYALPNARIMIHQPLGGFGGKASEVEIQTNEILYHKANLNRIMAAYTRQPIERIEKDTDRDFYMSPREARAYGLIDHIIGGKTSNTIHVGDTLPAEATTAASSSAASSGQGHA